MVAEVPVALTNVKFWRVVEPVASKFVNVANPLVISPAVSEPMLPLVLKRFVELAVVEKRLVVVAEVVVERVAVRAPTLISSAMIEVM